MPTSELELIRSPVSLCVVGHPNRGFITKKGGSLVLSKAGVLDHSNRINNLGAS